MKILVTGSEGKLGSRTCTLLKEQNHDVVHFDIRRDAREDVRRIEPLHLLDCDVVVHLAGIPHPNAGSFLDYVETNVNGTLQVVQSAVVADVKRVVYSSSTAYYGCNIKGKLRPPKFPIDETCPPASTGCGRGMLDAYNQSKVMAEQILAYYGTNKMVETVALRLAPANTKAAQYREDYDWEVDTTYRRGAFFANCHPDYAARAIVLAAEAKGPFWYEAFNIADRFVPDRVDVCKFLEKEYPNAHCSPWLASGGSLIDISKAIRMLGYVPCDER